MSRVGKHEQGDLYDRALAQHRDRPVHRRETGAAREARGVGDGEDCVGEAGLAFEGRGERCGACVSAAGQLAELVDRHP